MKLQILLIAILLAVCVNTEESVADLDFPAGTSGPLHRWEVQDAGGSGNTNQLTTCSHEDTVYFGPFTGGDIVSTTRILETHKSFALQFQILATSGSTDGVTLSFTQSDSNKFTTSNLIGTQDSEDSASKVKTKVTKSTEDCESTAKDLYTVEVLADSSLLSYTFEFNFSGSTSFGLKNFKIAIQDDVTNFSTDSYTTVSAEDSSSIFTCDVADTYRYNDQCVDSTNLEKCFDELVLYDTQDVADTSDHFEYSTQEDTENSVVHFIAKAKKSKVTFKKQSAPSGKNYDCLDYELNIAGYRITTSNTDRYDGYSENDNEGNPIYQHQYKLSIQYIKDISGNCKEITKDGAGNTEDDTIDTYECDASFSVIGNYAVQLVEKFKITFVISNVGAELTSQIIVDVETGSQNVGDQEAEFVAETKLEYCDDSSCSVASKESTAENPKQYQKGDTIYLKHYITSAYYKDTYYLKMKEFKLFSYSPATTIVKNDEKGYVIFSFEAQIAGSSLPFVVSSTLSNIVPVYPARILAEGESSDEDVVGEKVQSKIYLNVVERSEIVNEDLNDKENNNTTVVVEKSNGDNNLVIVVVSILAVIIVAAIVGAVFYLRNVQNQKQAPKQQEKENKEESYKLPQDIEVNNKCVTSER